LDLELREVGRYYRRPGRQVKALDGLSMSIRSGEFVCLVGPSGCGKTTVLHLLAGLAEPSAGEVLADGKPIAGPDPGRVLIFQEGALFPWLSVRANVEFGLRFRGVAKAERTAKGSELLEKVHLADFAHSWVHELSGGMKQKVALARALAVDPAVLLMDEPFGALDAMTRDRLHDELQELWGQSSKTVVFVTHNVREAAVLGDRIIVMSRSPGRVVAEFDVDLPRPRHMSDDGIMTIAGQVRAALER
jgi:NitT/TauT family transport system ATP-binding protein